MTDRSIEHFFNIARKLPVRQRGILLALYELSLRARLDKEPVQLTKGIAALQVVLKRLRRGGFTREEYRILNAIRLLRKDTKRHDNKEAFLETAREMGASAWKGKQRPSDEAFIAAWNETHGNGKERAKILERKLRGTWEAHYRHSQRLQKKGLLPRVRRGT